MLLLEFAQVEDFLLQLGLLVIVVGKNRAQSAGDKRECYHTGEHSHNTVQSLNGRRGRQVAVSHGRRRRHDEVEGHYIELVWIHFVVVRVPQPGIHIFIERGDENEQAR